MRRDGEPRSRAALALFARGCDVPPDLIPERPLMTAARRRLRLAASAFLALYLVLVGVVPALHAMDAGPYSAEAHFHGDEGDCAPGHDELHCAPCQFAFGTAADPAPRADLRLLNHEVLRAPHGEPADLRTVRSTPQSLPRAPPALR